jgi:hypothetical protein
MKQKWMLFSIMNLSTMEKLLVCHLQVGIHSFKTTRHGSSNTSSSNAGSFSQNRLSLLNKWRAFKYGGSRNNTRIFLAWPGLLINGQNQPPDAIIIFRPGIRRIRVSYEIEDFKTQILFVKRKDFVVLRFSGGNSEACIPSHSQ